MKNIVALFYSYISLCLYLPETEPDKDGGKFYIALHLNYNSEEEMITGIFR